MNDEHPQPSQWSPAELKLIERLRQHPELKERFERILEISDSAEGSIKKADEIEGLLIQELRRLGKDTMESWGSGVERTLAKQLKQKQPSTTVRKKKR